MPSENPWLRSSLNRAPSAFRAEPSRIAAARVGGINKEYISLVVKSGADQFRVSNQ